MDNTVAEAIGPVTLTDQAVARDAEQESILIDAEGDTRFGRVSEEITRRCRTNAQVREQVELYVRHCKDVKAKVSDLFIMDKHLAIGEEEPWYRFSRTAVANLAGFGGRYIVKAYGSSAANPGYRALRAYWTRPDDEASNEIFSSIARDFLSHIPAGRAVLARLYEDEDGRRVDALLTDRYGIIDNLWFLDVLSKNITDGLWANFKSDGRTIYGHYLIPDNHLTDHSTDYGGALAIRNSEVGKASLTVKPSVFNWVSQSGVIFGGLEGDALRRVHKGTPDLARLEETVVEHTTAQLPLFDSCIQLLEALKGVGAGDRMDIKRIIVDLGTQHGITNEEKCLWLAGVDAEHGMRGSLHTASDVVFGLSRAATMVDGHGRDAELEEIAGKIATPTRRSGNSAEGTWVTIMNRAAGLDDEKVEKVFEHTL